MLLYSAIMLAVAGLIFGLGAAIYRGNTDLIHDYHQTKVTDKKGYAIAFGRAMFVFGLGPGISGILGLLGEAAATASLIALFAGLGAGIVCIFRVQKKFNNGVF